MDSSSILIDMSHGDMHTGPTNPPAAAGYPEGWKTPLVGAGGACPGGLCEGSTRAVTPGTGGCAPRRVPRAEVLIQPLRLPPA